MRAIMNYLVGTQYPPQDQLRYRCRWGQADVFIHSRTFNMHLLSTYYVPGTEARYTKYTGLGLKEFKPGRENYSLEK